MNDGNAEQPSNSVGSSVEAPNAPISNPFWRFFWLEARVASATAQEFGPSLPGWRDFEFAREARVAVREIRELGETNYPVLLLERSEVLLLLRCHMQRHGIDTPGAVMTEHDWNRACQIPVIAKLWENLSTGQRSNVMTSLSSSAEMFLSEFDAPQRSQLAAALRDMASGLIEPLESDATRVRRIVLLRWSRMGAALLVAFVALWTLGSWLMDRSGKVNLALNHPVTISSQCAGLGTDHRLLVDGDHTNLGFHTDNGPNQFAVIDLGKIRRFDKVIVYNRADCCKERAVPMRLEVSNDGKTYTKLADRTEEFDIWTAKSLRAKGRYLRLRLLAVNPFHLAEVEVY